MKKKISTILFIGVIALISMGFRSQSTGSDFSGGSTITMIKGVSINSDRDRYWEKVTFGLSGLNSHDYISFVEIFDKKGGHICTVYDLQESYEKRFNLDEISWYSIDLNEYFIHGDFTLEVHVTDSKSGIPNNLLSIAAIGKTRGAPIDPDETILIVKYP